ncbi:FMN-binding negative transcriptional regulator [Flavobacterium caeni]|uniref:Negative transcriptional regulator, PaiB family n=1 Tax=Flavobacterium caeni TaxID=490189 RepID=A0A1G5FUC9_9FLAO|nr:FMN-binding negative transcriptional regulator [Flavobacterium caeni]SCY42992.1 negative transcriptional regulator, PaiB family [Flavobacterium caeni]
MYIPNQYQNTDRADVENFVKNNSFAILVNQTAGKLWATHLPLELETDANGHEVLRGHLAKANPQWKGFAENDQVLAIFSGAHAYVSSSWYDFEEVPTWNYSAVHVYGTIRTIDGDELLAHLTRLVDKYETASEHPVSVAGFSKKTMAQVRGVVGFEIKIDDIQAIRKLSQNRDAKNFKTIITELEKTGSPDAVAVAQDMKRCPFEK